MFLAGQMNLYVEGKSQAEEGAQKVETKRRRGGSEYQD